MSASSPGSPTASLAGLVKTWDVKDNVARTAHLEAVLAGTS